MIAYGFTTAQMVELVRAGLATAKAEHVIAGRQADSRIADAPRLAQSLRMRA
jgi:hypothetical protein